MTLARLKKCVGLLVAKQPGLHFEISAVVVGERLAPIEPIGINAPRPDFLGRKFFIFREMHNSGVGLRVPNSHERLAAAVDEH